MSKEINHIIFSPTDCLSEKMMFDYIDNKLTPKERHLMEKHLLDCEFCSDAMEGLELLKNRNRIKIVNQQIDEKVLPSTSNETKVVRFNYRLITSIAAGLLLLVGGVFFFNNFVNKSMKEASVAELKQTNPSFSPPVEKVMTDSESIVTTSGNEEKSGEEYEKGEQENQLALTKEVKPKPDYKTTITNGLAGAKTNLNQGIITKTSADEQANNNVILSDDSKIVLNERDKDIAGDQTTENVKEANGEVAGYSESVSKPASPSKQQEVNNVTVPEGLKKREDNLELADNRFRHEGKTKKDKVAKGEEEQSRVSYNTPAAPQTSSDKNQKSTASVDRSIGGVTMDSVFAMVEVAPQFPGGKDSLMMFVHNNFNYPSAYYSWDISLGTTISMEFIINEKGQVKNPEIIHGINSELNNEAERVVRKLPKWQPAMQSGKKVSYKYSLLIPLDAAGQTKQTIKK